MQPRDFRTGGAGEARITCRIICSCGGCCEGGKTSVLEGV